MKLWQALSYLRMDPGAPMKKQAHFKRRNSYQRNNGKVRSLQDAHFIPFNVADLDLFIDVIDDDLDIFTPDSNENPPVSGTLEL